MRCRHLVLALLVSGSACDEEGAVPNPRADDPNRESTGQTGMVRDNAGPMASVEGEVRLPPTAAIQPVELDDPMARPDESQQALDDRRMSNALDARANAFADEAPSGAADRIEDDRDEERAKNRGDGPPRPTAMAPHEALDAPATQPAPAAEDAGLRR